MSLGAPEFLWLLPILLLWIALDVGMSLRRRKRLHAFIPAELQDRARKQAGPELRVLRQVLGYLGLLLVTFSLSRPQWGYTWREAQREGLDLMVVVDTSNSMRADDFKPSRLQRAKWGIEEFVGQLQGDRTGLIAFAGEGVLQCPLTLDYGAFMMNVQDLFPGIVPRGGTHVQAALEKAIESFDPASEADKVILLITDGEAHEGDVDAIIRTLQREDIRVFAVGVGTPDGSLIPLDPTANEFLQNRNREVVKSRLDEATLRKLASGTDGLYVRANPRDFGVTELIEEGLKPLKRAQLEAERVREMEERFQIFLGAGLLCLLLEGLARLPGGWINRRST